MGILIVCKGADFSKCAVDKVEIPTEPDCNHVYDNACDTTCNLCGEVRTAPHNFVDGICTICGEKDPNDIRSYPVYDTSLKGLYALGGTADASLVNHAPEPHVNDGTEAFSGEYCEVEDNYVTFSGLAKEATMHTYLRLPLESGITTVILFSVPYVAGATSNGRPLFSNKSSGAANLTLTNYNVAYAKNATANTVAFEGGMINSENFAILAMTADVNGFRVVRYSNGRLNEIAECGEAIDVWTTNAIQIGGNSTSTKCGTANISLAAIHEGVLSDPQLESICEFVKEYGEGKGLTIE